MSLVENNRPVVSRLSENIYQIETPYDGFFIRSYVVVAESAAIIDTGLNYTAKVILDLLESIGSPRVGVAIHTHGHWDHIGGAAEVQEATGCMVAAHIDDADMLASHAENDKRFLKAFPGYPVSSEEYQVTHERMGSEVRVDLHLSGGECFNLGQGVVLQVVPMPGHTPGSIGIFEHNSGSLYAGDSLPERGPFGALAQYEDVQAYKDTIRRVMALNVKKIYTSHMDPKEGSEVKAFLENCLDEISVIDKSVRTAALHAKSLADAARRVCVDLNKPYVFQTLMTTKAHFDDMEMGLIV